MRLIILLTLCLFSTPVSAQTRSVYLEDLTWQEVKQRMQEGTNAILIPTGGTEQNGPALAIGKHNRIVAFTSGEIARQLGNTLVAPVVAYVPEGRISPPEGHMRFPGTISLREETFAALLEDTARSFRQHGFKVIAFLGDSGGNQRMQQYVADKLNREWEQEGVRVIHVGDYYAKNGGEKYAGQLNPPVTHKNSGGHGGFFDTAELMAIDARLVRPQAIRPYTPNDYLALGVSGDATGATPAQGRVLLMLKVKAAVAQIRDETGVALR